VGTVISIGISMDLHHGIIYGPESRNRTRTGELLGYHHEEEVMFLAIYQIDQLGRVVPAVGQRVEAGRRAATDQRAEAGRAAAIVRRAAVGRRAATGQGTEAGRAVTGEQRRTTGLGALD
jgi:hypothetical protein